MKITNHSRSPLGIPDVGILEPGQSAEAPKSIKDNNVIAAWFKAEMLVEGEQSVKPADNEQTTEESNIERSHDDDEKDTLIAALADKGIHKTRRSSVKTLREALDDAE